MSRTLSVRKVCFRDIKTSGMTNVDRFRSVGKHNRDFQLNNYQTQV
jgi:hypothetical protein